MQDDRAFEALNKLADVIANDESRKSFAKDPEGTLGAELKHIPQDVVAKVKHLSEDELKHLAELRETMIKAGLYVEHRSGYIACVL